MLANETGRRISAISALQVDDLQLTPTVQARHGAVVWPEDTDKMDTRWRCSISREAREALQQAMNRLDTDDGDLGAWGAPADG